MLTKNSLLEEIVKQLAEVKISDEVLAEKFYHSKRKTIHLESLHGVLGELHMQLALREICQAYGKPIIFDPIPSGAQTKHYRFRRNTFENLAVYRKRNERKQNGKQHGEFDELLCIDDLPVVFESKLHGIYSLQNKTIGGHLGRSAHLGGRYEAMHLQRIDRKLDPLREYFHKQQFGYVLVVYPSQVKMRHHLQEQFLQSGGILVPFPRDWEEHRRETRAFAEKLSV